MQEITILPPDQHKAGFLQRFMAIIELEEALVNARTSQDVARAYNQLIDFVLSECEIHAPEGADVRAVLMAMSRAEWINLQRAVGSSNGGAVPPPNGD
jgi:hypothetical protein